MARTTTKPIEEEKLYTTEEVASLLRTTLLTIRLAVRTGRLSAIKVGRSYRITGSAVDQYVKAQTR